jgi:hypothetical protein
MSNKAAPQRTCIAAHHAAYRSRSTRLAALPKTRAASSYLGSR